MIVINKKENQAVCVELSNGNTKRYVATLLEISTDQKEGVFNPSELSGLKIPEFSIDNGVILSGRCPIWVFSALTATLRQLPWIATLDPRLGGAVVTKTSSLVAPNIGEVVTIPK